jgi:hypothetical protein
MRSRLTRRVLVLLTAPLTSACSGSNENASENSTDPSEAMRRLMASEGANERPEGVLPVSFGPAECDQCLVERCGDQAAACTASAACSNLLSCSSDCSDQSQPMVCFGGCLMAGNPPAEFIAFLACLPSQCRTECASLAGSD